MTEKEALVLRAAQALNKEQRELVERYKVMNQVLEEEMFSWNFIADTEEEALKGHEEMCEKYK